MNGSGRTYTRMCILSILTSNYWMVVPHQLVENEAFAPGRVLLLPEPLWFWVEGRKFDSGCRNTPAAHIVVYYSVRDFAAGYTNEISYSDNIHRISALFIL